MSTIEQTAEQVFGSLNGFDRIAIAEQFGTTVDKLAENDSLMFVTALAFVVMRRAGASDADARRDALLLTNDELVAYFAEDTEAAAGKGGSPESSPGTSLSSVS